MNALAAAGAAGLALTVFLLAKSEPLVRMFFYLPAWCSVLLVIEGLNRGIRGSCLLDRPGEALRMAAFSVPAWLYYEAVNLRVENWCYQDLPEPAPVRWCGYALAFATVLPAILETAALLDRKRLSRPLPRLADGSLDPLYRVLGLACLFLPLAWPRLFFPLVWGAVFCLVEPWLARACPERSWLRSFADGRRGAMTSLLLSGLACGLLWEALNFWAGGKWVYTVPWPKGPKLFEMPWLGYLGFPPFALACASVWNFFDHRWRCMGPAARWTTAAALALVSLSVFRSMDLRTVRSLVPL